MKKLTIAIAIVAAYRILGNKLNPPAPKRKLSGRGPAIRQDVLGLYRR